MTLLWFPDSPSPRAGNPLPSTEGSSLAETVLSARGRNAGEMARPRGGLSRRPAFPRGPEDGPEMDWREAEGVDVEEESEDDLHDAESWPEENEEEEE